MLTRTAANNRTWAAYLSKFGVRTYSLPTIVTKQANPTPELEQILRHLEQFDWLIFTSAAGVRHTHTLLKRLGVSLTNAKRPAVATIGDQTATEAEQAGWRVASLPSQAEAITLAKELAPVEGKSILILRADIATEQLPAMLRSRGGTVTDLVVYQTQLRTDPDPTFSQLLQEGRIRCITFASPSAVHGFTQRVLPNDLHLARVLPVIAIGSTTALALEQAGFSQMRVASHPSIQAIRENLRQLPD